MKIQPELFVSPVLLVYVYIYIYVNSKMFREYFLNVDVLCISRYSKYTLAGIGSSLFVYNNQDLVLRVKIFDGERIHDFQVLKDFILIKGCKEVSVVMLFEEENKLKCKIQCKIKCLDWIQDVFCDLKKEHLILATAHNNIQVWSIDSRSCIQVYSCEESCILYSCKFLGSNIEDFVLLCGTVFSEVLIWAPSSLCLKDHPVLHRLNGHKGVIFSIAVDPYEKIICTTSDDRSIRVWSVLAQGSILERKNWEKAKISLIHTLYGHTARVWKSLLISDFIISAGEDSKLCFWNKTGRLIESYNLHQESGIRALSSSEDGYIVTGGEDGGISMLKRHNSQSSGYFSLNETEFGLPRKVLILEGVLCTTDRGCLMFTKDEVLTTKIYENKEFCTYCLLEMSTCKRYLLLGSIKGRIVIMEAESKIVCFDEYVVADRIFSLHWLDDRIVICGSEGAVTVYNIHLFPVYALEKEKLFSLPTSKERWSTCALIYEDYLILGDRMGSLHVYSISSSEVNPKQTFFRIHGHLGVTDIIKHGDAILTSGRDGTIKQFCISEGNFICCLKYKLPMDWPWKIVEYKSDTFVFGFNSVYFVAWDLKKREIIAKYDCGGGHRSCDFIIDEDYLKFIYVNNKKIRFVDLPLASSIHVRNGFHGKEINCLKIIGRNPVIAISGSEDTTLRITRITENNLEELYVLENHISSVRDLSIISNSKTQKIIFSAGGRAQISVHKFDLEALKYCEMENLYLSGSDRKIIVPSPEGETRVMCVDSIALKYGILLCAACSDRKIRIFCYEKNLVMLNVIPYSHCLLKVRFIEIDSHLLLLSMGTDGHVVFWNITNIKSNPDSYERIDSIRIHQSGINSFELKHLKSGEILLATGGDDNLLSVLLLKLNIHKKVDVLHEWTSSDTHSCQITGIKFVENAFLTTSVDQRLTVWAYHVKDNMVRVKLIKQCFSVVADIQGMEVSRNTSNSVLVCLYGKGLEITDVDLSTVRLGEMNNVKFEQVTGPMECGEGPHWDSSRKCLYMVDINRSLVLRYVPATREVFQAKVDGPSVSLIIPVKDTRDKFLIAVGRNLAIMTWDGIKNTVTKNELEVICSVEGDKPNNRFNDGKTDAKGRVLTGTMGAFINGSWEMKKGSLYTVGKDRVPKVITKDIGIANGLAWSLDYKTFYYIDSLAYRIDAFDYNLETGDATNRRVLFDLKLNGIDGLPDGMCTDSNGNLWVALYEGGLMCINPSTKQVLHKFTLPGCHITSVAFGGDNLDELYVTSAAQMMSSEERKMNPFFGCTFKISGLGVKGFDGIPVIL